MTNKSEKILPFRFILEKHVAKINMLILATCSSQRNVNINIFVIKRCLSFHDIFHDIYMLIQKSIYQFFHVCVYFTFLFRLISTIR